MRRSVLFVVAAMALTACAPTPAPTPAPRKTDDHGLTEYLDGLVDRKEFRGAVEVMRGDDVLLSKGFDQADVAADAPNTPDTRFRIGSVTKQFTAMAVLILQEDGKVRVGDQVCTHLANCPATWQNITVEQLLTHTSGLGDINDLTEADLAGYAVEFGDRPTPAQLIGIFVDWPLKFVSGAQYRYSSPGYDLLGVLVEQLSGQTFGEFLHDRILEPLGMADTAYEPDQQDSARDAVGYQNWTTAGAVFPDAANFASGGMYSTGPDLGRWQRFLMTGAPAIVDQDTLAEMLRPRVQAAIGVRYGYGVETQGNGDLATFSHGGAVPGFRTHVLARPSTGISVVVLSNLETFSPKLVADNLLALAST